MAAPILVTIATQRSGTKFLGACLNAGDAVRSFGEPFKPPPPDSPFPAFAIDWMARRPGFAFRDTEIAAMLDAFLDSLAAAAATQGRLAHLDVMYNNLGAFTGAWTWPVRPGGESTLCRVLRARGAGVIHLVRDSLAESVASTLIAEQRGYHRRTPLPPDQGALRITADLAAAERQMRDILAARAFVRRAFRGHGAWLELAYPDFIAGQALAPGAAARLAGLPGLPPGRAVAGPCALHPTAPDRAAVVTNWEDLVALEARLRAAG
jgi:LPS sulfotransferase NodH